MDDYAPDVSLTRMKGMWGGEAHNRIALLQRLRRQGRAFLPQSLHPVRAARGIQSDSRQYGRPTRTRR
jgi:hypothetical protein